MEESLLDVENIYIEMYLNVPKCAVHKISDETMYVNKKGRKQDEMTGMA